MSRYVFYHSQVFYTDKIKFLGNGDRITEELFQVPFLWFMKANNIRNSDPFSNTGLDKLEAFKDANSESSVEYYKKSIEILLELVRNDSFKEFSNFVNDRDFEGHNDRSLAYHIGRVKYFYRIAQTRPLDPIILRGCLGYNNTSAERLGLEPYLILYDGNHRLLAYMLKYASVMKDFREHLDSDIFKSIKIEVLYLGRLSIMINALANIRP